MFKFKLEQLNKAVGGGLEKGQLCVIMGSPGSGLETIANSAVCSNDFNAADLIFGELSENNFNITKYKNENYSTLLKLVLNKKSILSNGEFSGGYDEKSKSIFQNILKQPTQLCFFARRYFTKMGLQIIIFLFARCLNLRY